MTKQSSHLGHACKLSYLLRKVKICRTELCFSSVTEPWRGTDFQQTGHTAFTAFTNYLHLKHIHKNNLSHVSLASEVPGNRTMKQQVAQQICTTPDQEKPSCM